MNDIHIASGPGAEDTGLPPQLFAGDTPAVATQDLLLELAADVPAYTPLMQGAEGDLEPWGGSSADPIVALTAFAVPAGSQVRKAVYVAGMFNIDAINWPAADTEEAVVQAATLTSQVRFRKLLHSDKRTGGEAPYVGPGYEAGSIVLVPQNTALADGDQDGVYNDSPALSVAGEPNGPLLFEVIAGALPTGLSLNATTGAITGTPTVPGSFAFTIKVTDAGGRTSSSAYTILINPA